MITPIAIPHSTPCCDAFREFVHRLPEDGLVVACGEDAAASMLAREATRRLLYGFRPSLDWYATEIRPNNAGGIDFLAYHHGKTQGIARLRVPGKHNVLNALAAIIKKYTSF